MPTDGPAKPWPKAASTKPQRPRRYRRFTASAKQWAVLRQTKAGPCRVCGMADWNGAVEKSLQLHHVVSRTHGGDDLADNLVPLCPKDHDYITRRDPIVALILLSSLTDAEYSYAVAKAGEGYFERAYGVPYSR